VTDDLRTIRIAWRAAPEDPSRLDSTVTFTLEPEGRGTRLFLVHDGFDPDDPWQLASRRILGGGWKGAAGRMPEVIEAAERGNSQVRAKILGDFRVEMPLIG
jgi:uncharacterized protein YndB with AHSA1/START domain